MKLKVPRFQTQDFFFSKNDKGKLIQNMVFEFIDDNLENLIERHINLKTAIPERQVKVHLSGS